MTKTIKISLRAGLLCSCLTILLFTSLGCLHETDDKDPDGGGKITSGTIQLKGFPFYTNGRDRTDTVGYCDILIDCLCRRGFEDSECVEHFSSLPDSECKALLEDEYDECLFDNDDDDEIDTEYE
ncbi:MAG: hypothetical protein GY845_02130 [Planctomycetes bacterium]|nr:hypothetical protein [Planctomycetota bacterium]